MSLKLYSADMLRYERWANGRVLDYLRSHPDSPHLREIFSHQVADMLPWICLLRGIAIDDILLQTIAHSPGWTIAECQRQLDAVQDELDAFVDSLSEADMGRAIESIGPHGQTFTNTIAQILTHILSHAQHHRGQIEWLVEWHAGAYLATSYMTYLRRQDRP